MAIVAFIVGVLLGMVGVHVAKWRRGAQPISVDIQAERTVVAALLNDPKKIEDMQEIETEMFTSPECRTFWKLISQDGGTEKTFETTKSTRDFVATYGGNESDVEDCIQKVVDAAYDRDFFGGKMPLEPTSDPEHPLAYRDVPVTWTRLLFGGVAGGVGLWFAHWATTDIRSFLAVAILVLGSIVLAFVDADTLFIDYPTLVVVAALGWGLAGTANWQNFPLALVATLALLAGLAVVAFGYKALRGAVGLGGGDFVLLVATAGIPLLVTGSVLVVLWGIIAGGILAVTVRLALLVAGKVRYDEPFALGPYLCAGWVLGWLAVGGIS